MLHGAEPERGTMMRSALMCARLICMHMVEEGQDRVPLLVGRVAGWLAGAYRPDREGRYGREDVVVGAQGLATETRALERVRLGPREVACASVGGRAAGTGAAAIRRARPQANCVASGITASSVETSSPRSPPCTPPAQT